MRSNKMSGPPGGTHSQKPFGSHPSVMRCPRADSPNIAVLAVGASPCYRQPLKPTTPETDSPEPVSVWPRQQAHPSACVGPGVAVTASWLKQGGRK